MASSSPSSTVPTSLRAIRSQLLHSITFHMSLYLVVGFCSWDAGACSILFFRRSAIFSRGISIARDDRTQTKQSELALHPVARAPTNPTNSSKSQHQKKRQEQTIETNLQTRFRTMANLCSSLPSFWPSLPSMRLSFTSRHLSVVFSVLRVNPLFVRSISLSDRVEPIDR
ncbi:hypothetical protein L211DRAFT_703858 [Terfezia boudieri ATCC MYA-4762]|uniref:Uncharacterized protein n=1 Tax=Terfezia boudieri ATCC MYA-4762 TaxID=1051890 RepID=A0A3N4LYP4_9PEZI|nr:hypothetical protein L211DRAFT_703858 [Terfezia boudieri ATCC MYA-4762]